MPMRASPACVLLLHVWFRQVPYPMPSSVNLAGRCVNLASCGYGRGMNDSDKLLRIYVNDHRAGAVAGVSLCRRIKQQEKGTPMGDLAAELLVEIEADSRELDRYAESNGIAADPVKQIGAAVAECVSRLKFNSYVVRRSPLSAVLETETLMAGIDARRSLWMSIRAGDRIAPFDVDRLEQLIGRAKSQRDRLEAQHREAARLALAVPDGAAVRP